MVICWFSAEKVDTSYLSTSKEINSSEQDNEENESEEVVQVDFPIENEDDEDKSKNEEKPDEQPPISIYISATIVILLPKKRQTLNGI